MSLLPDIPEAVTAEPTKKHALVHAFGVIETVGTDLSWDEINDPARLADFEWVWLHFDVNEPDTRRWIEGRPEIPATAASALLAGETRPRATAYDAGVFVNLRGINLNPGEEPEDMVSLRIWADAKKVVTTRRRLVKAIGDVRDEVRNQGGPGSPAELLTRLAHKMTSRIDPYILEITDKVDALEEELIAGKTARMRPRLAETRSDAVLLRRYIAPQRDALAALALSETPLLDQRRRVELRELADTVARMTEDIDAARERAIVMQDQLTDQRAEEMNRNMMILSVVAAIFLPLSFITGLLGINVGGMPGADDPRAFWVVAGFCALLGGALAMYFARKGWL